MFVPPISNRTLSKTASLECYFSPPVVALRLISDVALYITAKHKNDHKHLHCGGNQQQ